MAEKLGVGAIGAAVARLHEELQRNNCEVPAEEVRRQFFGPLTRQAVLAYQREHGLACSGEVDQWTTAVLFGNPQPRAGRIASAGNSSARGGTRASTLVPEAPPNRALGRLISPPPSFVVSGRVYSEDRAGIGGLRIEVVDRNVAGDVTLAEATSDDAGCYTASFPADTITRQGKSAPDLQVRVSDGATVLGASEVRYDATPQETLDVVLPVGLRVDGVDASGTSTSGSDTAAPVREFQRLYRLPETGHVDAVTDGVRRLAALVATHSNRAQLRSALHDAVGAVSGSREYNDRLARAAVMAGDYTLALRLSPRLRDLSGADVDLGGAVFTDGGGPGSPRQPEVPFPENFYTYRHSLMTDEDIAALRTSAPTGGMPGLTRIASPAGGLGNEGPVETVPGGPVEPPPGVPDPPPATGLGMTRSERLNASALAFLNAIEAWQFGNNEYGRQRYASAIAAHNRCQQAVLDYFSMFPDYDIHFTTSTLAERIDELVWRAAADGQAWADVWTQLTWRRQLLSLAEIGQFDWTPITGGRYAHIAYQLLRGNLLGSDQPPPPTNPIGPQHRKIFIDTRLLVIAAVFVPLARGEANRMRRLYSDAIEDFSRVLRNSVSEPGADPPTTVPALLACEFIEIPFARLLLIETMLDQAEAQYKARTSVDDEPDDTKRTQQLGRTDQIAQDLTSRAIPGDPRPGAQPLQHLVAAITYADAVDAMNDDGDYVPRARQAVDDLVNRVASVLGSGDVTSMSFRALGKEITVPTVAAVDNSLPGLTSGTHPHEPYLQFVVPNGELAMRERNPRVYALLLQAQARLLQIWNGFNYLSYRDDYTPPWRFQFLLDRARYLAEHTKNAQRDYLNFLNNAENEEFKELSAAQNVELEKANVQIETARLDQARKEVAAAQQSMELAEMNAAHAQERFDEYAKFDEYADRLFHTGTGAPEPVELVSRAFRLIRFSNLEPLAAAAGDLFSGGAVSGRKQVLLADEQRDFEKFNLGLAIAEADKAAQVAHSQVAVTQGGLLVAGLQRQAALLRHEHALQNLQFMRNRTLNTEQWYRLASAIRSVSDSYLRYAIEMAFLAQQAYNFEADKRLDVIRFDYDLSDVGAMLAADFLLRDLDGLEQDLIVSQTTRQQQVKYVLSMAREFPETLRDLADTNTTLFSMRLEQLERRFPGLANLRIAGVDVLPLCLMDASRFSVQLKHLGTGMVRLKAQPGTSPLNTTDLGAAGDWLTGLAADWPVKIHTSGPETTVFSGLSRQETTALSSITANERGAFEGLPGASAWQIDMSMKENRTVPNSLADVLVTFTLSGYYDDSLRTAIDQASLQPMATTTWLSAQQTFPDAFYEFNQNARMEWSVTQDLLSPQGAVGALRNVGIVGVPAPQRAELGRILCSYPIEFEVDATANVTLRRSLPLLSFATNGLTLTITLNTPPASTVSFDFGDGTGLFDSTILSHTYATPGRYEVFVRIASNQRLTEYRAAVVVSRQHAVQLPCVAIPVFNTSVSGARVKLEPTLQVPSGEPLTVSWHIDGREPDPTSSAVAFLLDPGRYVLRFTAVRPLSARFYSSQRFDPATPIPLDGLHVATNRTFDPATGAETTANLNPFGQHVFGADTLSPLDRWTFELPIQANPALLSVSASDTERPDLGELADVLLTVEYTGEAP